jgi:hypothetical protein
MYICSDVNWKGKCHNYYNNTGTGPDDCTAIDGSASSMGPERGFVCWVYRYVCFNHLLPPSQNFGRKITSTAVADDVWYCSNAFCIPHASDGSDMLQLVYPGESNLVFTSHGNWNDRVYSYHCLPTEEAAAWMAKMGM